MFGTDNGPACTFGLCGGTVYAYSPHLQSTDGRWRVDVLCVGCHARFRFDLPADAYVLGGAPYLRSEHERAREGRRLFWYGGAPWERGKVAA